MKRIFLSILASIGLLAGLPQPSSAEQAHTGTLKWIYPQADGSYVLTFDTNPSACPNANATKYLYVQVGQNGMTAESAKYIYAAALSAMSLGKQLQVYYNDASIYCYINRAVLIN